MRVTIAAMVIVLGLPLVVAACLWDRDTPASEAKGMPEVVAVLTGRFERYPPLYYEMRLKRVSGLLAKHPDQLDLYDDAGVACDRLGRGDEAIGWMVKKRAQLDQRSASDPEEKEHLYRYHANLGTFLIHRWIRQGADRAKLDEARAARAEIEQAIQSNPDAHFGREVYQLRAMDFLIDPPPRRNTWDPLPNLLGWSFDDIYGSETAPEEAHKAVRGLTGLVVLGNAWESVDVFHALNVALRRDSTGFERGRDGGRNTLAHLAWLRCRELVRSGHGSLYPGVPTGEALERLLPRPGFITPEPLLERTYGELRDEAERWQAARTAFMMERLKQGRHPDTDPEFWRGYTSPPAPELPSQSVPDAFYAHQAWQRRVALGVVLGAPAGLVVLGVALRIWWKRRATRAAAQEKKEWAEL